MLNPIVIAYCGLKLLGDDREDDAYIEQTIAVNLGIAKMLGYRLQEPTNFPAWTISISRTACPYRNRSEFMELPDYVNDLNSSLEIGPVGTELSLQQTKDKWIASYRKVAGDILSSEAATSPARAVVLAGLVARAALANAQLPSVEIMSAVGGSGMPHQ
jgi:hypothetical protein